jgi:hypothetical protein
MDKKKNRQGSTKSAKSAKSRKSAGKGQTIPEEKLKAFLLAIQYRLLIQD